MDASAAPLILSPGRIGALEIRNRVVTSSMCLYFSGKDGEVTDKMTAFFAERANGGMGAFVIPANPHGENKRARGSLAGDARIGQWKPLLDALHTAGAKAFCQIHPSGIQFGRAGFKDEASPFELTTRELEQLIESYALGALRAKKAGFDGVEIHGAHGHEVALLLSERLNTRRDKYGGTLENCARSVTEMISRMKGLCGADFPVILRLSGEERISGGREIGGSLEICRLAQAAGANAIHVSVGMPASEEWECPPSEIEQGHLAWMGKTLKEGLSIPVIVVGRIVDWEVGERMIANGEADFVSMARASLAEAQWVKSVAVLAKGKPFPIRRCIACNQGCRTRREQNKSMAACLQNPRLGREELVRITEDLKGRRISVIGGGVAGLEAANVLSGRGAAVTLFEAEDRLGGTFRWASKAPGKASYANVTRYYEEILPRQGVRIETGRKLESAPEGAWDAIVLATGGNAIRPPIGVSGGIKVWSALDFIRRGVFGGGLFVIIGDGIIGYEVADSVIEQGGKAMIVGDDPRAQTATLGVARWRFMEKRFQKKGVALIRRSTVENIAAEGLTIKDREGAVRQIEIGESFECVLACGYKAANPDSLERFRKEGAPLLAVGNADSAGDAMDAIHSAFEKSIALTLS